ncbi:DUF1801 domain-containing protein [Pelomonas sp. SE-A7]|uniref:DUF1801 domain-containing protein n=1 Tax=Pelomonas sp. SE-A7 TaxID=3054953 RepID=UPI00259C8754|nr:DUF1801 domain-containing protein [Pelomonas sp. SE-A7]MDM4766604.1 DUF1801 domain-containing protein [Pelomonas sp. SE-A7]
MKTPTPAAAADSASAQIDAKIAALADWRGAMLAKVRALMHAALPEVVEEVKWMGTPCWSCQGLITTCETYKQVVKLTFANGASLSDPAKLFNSSLDGNVRRAIDIREGEKLDEKALKALFQQAAAFNAAKKSQKKSPAMKPAAAKE